ncbi:hypothetical protein CEXT_496181 [Caerostris extrusa]|uniref:Uncharacterized protein n=1 Tax=Caerostris extrusa TaxID=172846 RepID=A0AAV4THJ1_CAEEX|nr:hypothetical protein CEXT_496181 [Caerostris extrusa]
MAWKCSHKRTLTAKQRDKDLIPTGVIYFLITSLIRQFGHPMGLCFSPRQLLKNEEEGKKVGESSASSEKHKLHFNGSYPYKPPTGINPISYPIYHAKSKCWKNSISQQRPPPAKIKRMAHINTNPPPPPASIQTRVPSTIPNQECWKNSISQQRPPPAEIKNGYVPFNKRTPAKDELIFRISPPAQERLGINNHYNIFWRETAIICFHFQPNPFLEKHKLHSNSSYPYKPPPASIQSRIPSTIPNQECWKNSIRQQRRPKAKNKKKNEVFLSTKDLPPKMNSSSESRPLHKNDCG